jgi:hypothetical protein
LPAEQAKERTTPEFWSYLEALTPAEWDRHMLYIYRRVGETGPMPFLEKSAGSMRMPDGSVVGLTDRESVESSIVQKYGGPTFRLILKRGSERITETRIMSEEPARTPPHVAGDYATGSPGPVVTSDASAAADVARNAFNAISSQEKTGFDVAGTALRTSAEVLARFAAAPATPARSESDEMFRMMMLKMMERMLEPPDPLALVTKIVELMGKLNPAAGAAAAAGASTASPALNKIVDTALDRLLNPPAASGPVSSTGAELVRQLPTVASYVSQAIQEWRIGTEAQRDTARMMTGRKPEQPGAPGAIAQPGRPGPSPVVASPAILPAPAPSQAQPGTGAPSQAPSQAQPATGAPSLEFIESRIVSILHEPISADEAAQLTVDFLSTLDPGDGKNPSLLDQLRTLGPHGLFGLFHSRPVLRPCAQNVPRLQEFIKHFLRYANLPPEDQAAGSAGGEGQPVPSA